MKTSSLVMVCILAALIAGYAITAPPNPKYDYDPTPRQVTKAVKEMRLKNIPTFGPVFKEWLLASYRRDYHAAYATISTASKAAMLQVAGARIYSDKKSIEIWQQQLADPNTTAEQKAELQKNIDKYSAYIAGREACKGDGEKLYAYITEWIVQPKKHNPVHLYILGDTKFSFTKEVIKGDIGYALSNDPIDASKTHFAKYYFVKENGVWKYDYATTVQIQDENDPPPNPVPIQPNNPNPQPRTVDSAAGKKQSRRHASAAGFLMRSISSNF